MSELTKVVHVRLSPELADALEEKSLRLDVSRSELTRRSLVWAITDDISMQDCLGEVIAKLTNLYRERGGVTA